MDPWRILKKKVKSRENPGERMNRGNGGPLESLFTVHKCILEYTMNSVSVTNNWFSGLFKFNLIRLMSKQ